MDTFDVIHRGQDTSGPFAGYLYEVRRNDRKVAELRHSHRGEDIYIRLSSLGEWEPFDKVLEGGGPEPLRLTSAGEALLLEILSRRSV